MKQEADLSFIGAPGSNMVVSAVYLEDGRYPPSAYSRAQLLSVSRSNRELASADDG